MKTCTKCAETKPLEQFGKQASLKSGLRYHCRACDRAYMAARYAANKERLLAQMREKHAANPQPVRDRMAAWVKANPERHSENRERWASKNPEKTKQIQRTASAKYRAANMDKHAALQNRRRAKKLDASTTWDADFDNLVEMEAAHLAKLRKSAFGFLWHIDHVVPLQGKTVCGLHNAYNLAVIPATDNIRKKNFHWPDMPC